MRLAVSRTDRERVWASMMVLSEIRGRCDHYLYWSHVVKQAAVGYCFVMNAMTTPAPPSRGPADHTVRDQIVEAAHEHFSRFGYEKTTVSDLAKSIGFSKAYIYKFFDSKQAIGEAICAKTIRAMVGTVEEAVA